jgi:hypothetical protein
VFFSVELSVEEFWDTKSQIMGVGFGGFVGQTPLGAAKVYHITSGFVLMFFSAILHKWGCFLDKFGAPVPYPPFTFATVVGGIYLYTTDRVYYHMTTRYSFGWMAGWMDETNMMVEDETTRGDEIG